MEKKRPTARIVIQVVSGLLIFSYGVLIIIDRLPPPQTDAASKLLDAIREARFFMPTIAALYLLVGLSWVVNRFAALATIALTPMVINVALFHAVLSPGTLFAAVLIGAPWGAMVYLQWARIRPLLRAR